MGEEFTASGYCRAIDGTRILVCELTEHGELDSGCKYPDCVYVPSCPLIADALEKAEQQKKELGIE